MHFLTEDSISQLALSLCLSIRLSAYLFLTLPSPFLLQTNSRLKQIEKEYGQKLAKSAQVISFLPPPPFILYSSFSTEPLERLDKRTDGRGEGSTHENTHTLS